MRRPTIHLVRTISVECSQGTCIDYWPWSCIRVKRTVAILSPIDVVHCVIRIGKWALATSRTLLQLFIYKRNLLINFLVMLTAFSITSNNAYRWYYTSDTVVKETTIDEVLSASAYMLYYDRGTGPTRQPM